MTSSPPLEAPHFRGKTLTPESPRPIHIPEPENIPVLHNQIDQHFNLMSTHIAQGASIRDYNFQQHYANAMLQATASDNPAIKSTANMMHTLGNGESGTEVQSSLGQPSDGQSENFNVQKEADTSTNPLNHDQQPSASLGSYASLATASKTDPAQVPESQNHESDVNVQAASSDSDLPQGTSVTQDGKTFAPAQGEFEVQPQSLTSEVEDEGVNFQALLDNLSPSTSAPTSAEIIAAPTTNVPSEAAPPLSPNSAQTPIAILPIPPGLPARPPPQDKPAIHPNYTPGEDIRSYHNPPAQSSNASSYNAQASNPQRPSHNYVQNNGVAPSGLPPPPLATFQQPNPKINQAQNSPQTPLFRQNENHGRGGGQGMPQDHDSQDHFSSGGDVERLYEQFLKDEAVYVSEGTWDRFPQGSRLFVGNLFTERVSKRDLFSVFHKYGRLAQISMKSAYGFVQYHNTEACLEALQNEEGTEIQGRKIHLEISKPQKNTRNAAATAAGDSLRAGYSRRSRSPDYGRGGSMRMSDQLSARDQHNRNQVSANHGRPVRDEYRPARSPSPRGYSTRDSFRPGRQRSPDRYYRGRSRSPYDRNGGYRSRSPRGLDMEDEANLPIMRRNPRDVPDVQIILVEEVDRTFVDYIAQTLRQRGLRCDVLKLPRVSLAAVVKRQIVEGVQAVVKIYRHSQIKGKIPLQVYNRSAGVNNVKYEEYEDLDATIAAEIVIRAKTTFAAPAPTPTQYQAPPPYGQPQYPQQQQFQQQMQIQNMSPQQQPPSSGGPPNLANLITSLDGPALQKLLGAMGQNPQTPQTPQTPAHTQQSPSNQQRPGQTQDLASLLKSVAQQQPQQQGYPYGGPQQPQNVYNPPTPTQGYSNMQGQQPYGGPAGRLPMQGTPQQYGQPGQLPQQNVNVQDMLAQLAKYRQ